MTTSDGRDCQELMNIVSLRHKAGFEDTEAVTEGSQLWWCKGRQGTRKRGSKTTLKCIWRLFGECRQS